MPVVERSQLVNAPRPCQQVAPGGGMLWNQSDPACGRARQRAEDPIGSSGHAADVWRGSGDLEILDDPYPAPRPGGGERRMQGSRVRRGDAN